MQIDPAHRPPHYAQFATFQPTSLYELIWNLLLAGFLAWLVRRHRFRAPGVFALYVAGYSGFRIFEESLRIDYSQYILGMRLNFWIATLITLAALLWFTAIQRGRARTASSTASTMTRDSDSLSRAVRSGAGSGNNRAS